MKLKKMGITVKTARIALLVAVFCITLGWFCQNALAQTWNGGAYGTPNSKSHAWWGMGTLTTENNPNNNKYWTNWGAIRTTGAGPFTDYLIFSQGSSVTFTGTGSDGVFVDTSTPYGPNNILSNGAYGSLYGFRADYRTVVGDMMVTGGSWPFAGSGVIGNSLTLNGTSNLTLSGTKFSFAYGTQWNTGSISFSGNNVFGEYYWDPKATINGIGTEGQSGYEYWSSRQYLNPADLGVINRDHNTIFLVGSQSNYTISRPFTTSGGEDYTLANRFDVGEGRTLTLGTPWNRSATITGVNAFESRPTSEFRVSGGAIYLRKGADLARSVNGNGTEPGAWNFISNYGYQGGAVFAEQNLSLYGNSRISANEAANRGGAIFMNGSQTKNILRLNTLNGDIAFHDNVSYGLDNTNTFAKLSFDPITNVPTALAANSAGNFIDSSNNAVNKFNNTWLYVDGNNNYLTDISGTPVSFSSVAAGWFNVNQNGDFINSSSHTIDYVTGIGWLNVNQNKDIVAAISGYDVPVARAADGTSNWYPFDAATGVFYEITGTNPTNPATRNAVRFSPGTGWQRYDAIRDTFVSQNNTAVTYLGAGTIGWYRIDFNTGNFIANIPGVGNDQVVNYVYNDWYRVDANNRVLNPTGAAVAPSPITGTADWYRIDSGSNQFLAANNITVRYYAGTNSWYRIANINGQWVYVQPNGTTPVANQSAPNVDGQLVASGPLTSAAAVNVTNNPLTMATVNMTGTTIMDTISGAVATAGISQGTPVTAGNPASVVSQKDDAIYLAKNIDVVIDGSRRVFFEDNITTNLDPDSVEAGHNTLTVQLTGLPTESFVQFGKGTDSILNPKGKDGGTVLIESGTFRMSDSSRFQTFGSSNADNPNPPVFTVNKGATLAGGGTGGKSNSTEFTYDPAAAGYTAPTGSGTIGAADGFIIHGNLSPDNYNFLIPQNLDGRSTLPTPGSEAIGYLNLWGNVTLSGATFQVDLGTSAAKLQDVTASGGNKPFAAANGEVLNSDIIMVDQIHDTTGSGIIYLTKGAANKSTVAINSWTGKGKYVIATSNVGIKDVNVTDIDITNDNIDDYFNEIIPTGVTNTQNKRRVAGLSIDEKLLGMGERDIVLQTSNEGNVNLVWTGKFNDMTWSDTDDHSTTAVDEGVINWKRRFNNKPINPTIDLSFWEGDIVYFDVSNIDLKYDPFGQHQILTISPATGLTVGGMVVEGGDFLFYGKQLIGGTNSDGLNAIGRLDIRLTDTAATAGTNVILDLATDFEKGNRISSNKGISATETTVVLGSNQSFGKYIAGAKNEHGTVYIYDFINQTGTDATIVTSYGGDARTLQNHFEVRDGSNLTFKLNDLTNGKLTKLTINGVDTSLSDLDNKQTHKGGAFYVGTGSTVKWDGNLNLTDNTALYGGAFYAERNLTIFGNTKFENNIAVNDGGAIYMAGSGSMQTLLLNTATNGDNGDIVFTGNNRDQNGANSVFLNQNVTLSIVGDNNVFFDDPINSGTTLATSGSSQNNFRMADFTGIVQFQGNNVLNVSDALRGGDVQVQSGTFRLANGATFSSYVEAGKSTASFTVRNGASLTGNGTINLSTAQDNGFTFNSGSTLSPDSGIAFKSKLHGVDEKVSVSSTNAAEAIGTLTLNGSNVNFDGTILRIQVTTNSDGTGGASLGIDPTDNDYIKVTGGNILLTGKTYIAVSTVPQTANPSGKYLIASTDMKFVSNTGNTVAELIKYIDSNLLGSPDRIGSGAIKFGLDYDTNIAGNSEANQLWITDYTGTKNLTVYWTGKETIKAWDEATTKNWKNGPLGGETEFYTYDYVIFDSNTVPVLDYNVRLDIDAQVSGMDVLSGDEDYIISGNGKITGTAGTGNFDVPPAVTGKLTVGNAKLTLGVETDFENGTELQAGGQITIGHDKALGTYAGAVKGSVAVTGNAAIVAADDKDYTIVNFFDVQAGNLTFSVGDGKTLTLSSAYQSVELADGSSLVKDGDGDLVFTGANANPAAGTPEINFAGSGKIDAKAGNIIFDNNGAKAINAVGNLELTGNADSNILFNTDNIESDAITVAGNLDITKDVTVIVNNTASTVGGNTTISGKANFVVTANKTFNAGTTFELQSDATVSGGSASGAITTIKATDIILNGTVDPVSKTYTVGDLNNPTIANGGIATLRFDGETTLDGATIKIDLGANGASDLVQSTGNITLLAVTTLEFTAGANATPASEYMIVQSTTGTFDDTSNPFAHFSIAGLGTAERGTGDTLEFRNNNIKIANPNDAANQLWLVKGADKNLEVYWTGKEATNAWDIKTTKNWQNGPAGDTNGTAFYTYDYVIFDNDTVAVTNYDVQLGVTAQVIGMDVLSGDQEYTISGNGKIIGIKGQGTLADGTKDTGKLTVGNAKLSLGVETHFAGGTELKEGAQVTIGNNQALGAYNNANPVGEGYVAVTGNATITTGTDKNIRNRFNVAADKTAAFDVATGTTLTIDGVETAQNGGAVHLSNGAQITQTNEGTLAFTNNKAANGGAVYGEGSVNIDSGNGMTTFTGNTATTNGGAVNAVNDVALKGTITFDNNAAASGGAIAAENVTISATATDVTFTNNTASNRGGAINAAGNVDINSAATFTENTAANRGGAINAAGNVTLNSATRFEKNSATTGDGGAVYTTGNVTVSGGSRFIDNAANNGGAIFMNGAAQKTLAFNTTNGDIVFDGNTAATATQGGAVNAANTTIAVTGDNQVYFGANDTVVTNGVNSNFTQIGSSTAIFNGKANIGGKAIIGDGTNAATFFVDGNTTFNAGDTFTLLKNATITGKGTVGSANGNTIRGTLDPNNDTYTYNRSTDSIDYTSYTSGTTPFPVLTFDGNTTFDGALLSIDLGNNDQSDRIDVKGTLTVINSTVGLSNMITVNDFVAGTFDIITNNTNFDPSVLRQLQIDPTTVGSRTDYTLKLKDNEPNIIQLVGTTGKNIKLYWDGNNGGTDDAYWHKADASKMNWQDKDGVDQYFIENDYVVFNTIGAAQPSVMLLDNKTYNVSGMEVSNGTYTFEQNTPPAKLLTEIKGIQDDTFESQNLGTKTGNLDITDATATFRVKLAFDNVNLTRANVILDNADAYGNGLTTSIEDYNGFITVIGDSTLKTMNSVNPVNGYTLNHEIKLNNGNLTVDAVNTLTLNKELSGTGNFTINKGKVEFAVGTNNVINGDFSVNTDATLFANENVTIESNQFTLNTGAALTAGKNVTITAKELLLSGTVEVTQTTDELTFIVNGNHTTIDGATLLVDLSNASAPISISGGVFIKTGNILDVTSELDWENGEEYAVITSAGIIPTANLKSLFILQENGVTFDVDGSRKDYDIVLKNDNKDLFLQLKAGDNDELFWTGSAANNTAWDVDTTQNWVRTNDLSTPTTFLNHDYVNFDVDKSDNNNLVDLDGAVRTVSGMSIFNGEFTFDNGTLNGQDAGTNANAKRTAALDIDGDGKLTFNIDTHFNNGINVKSDRTIVIGKDAALGSTVAGTTKGTNEGNISIAKNVTIETNGDRTIDNRFNLAAKAKLTVDTTYGDLNLTNLQALNGLGSNDFIKAGSGIVTLTGTDNKLGANSTVTVAEGTLLLDTNAKLELGADSNATVQQDGIVLVKAGAVLNAGKTFTSETGSLVTGTGTIAAKEITLHGNVEVAQADQLTFDGETTFDGATLRVDLSGNAPINITNGSAAILAANGKNILDVTSVLDWDGEKEYVVITAANGIVPTTNLKSLFTLKKNGTPFDNDNDDEDSRKYDYDIVLGNAGNDLVLKLLKTGDNRELYWEGDLSTAWNASTKNWVESDKESPTIFRNGDYVNFTQTVSGNNNLVDLGGSHTVSGMYIIDGDFEFNNGTLNGTMNGFKPTGALDIDGDGELTLNIETHFEGGINVYGNRTIVIGKDAALGSTKRSNGDEGIVNIAADKNVTIETSDGSKTIDNRFNLKTGAKLTVNTSNGDLDLTNALNGDGNNAFIKAGLGTVTLNGTNNVLGNESTVTVGEGTLLLDTNAKLELGNGSTVIVAQGTLHVKDRAELNAGKAFISIDISTVKGTGTITAETLNISGTLVNGDGDANYANQTGTLTFNGNAKFENVQLNLDLANGDTTNNIHVNGTVDFGTDNVIVLHTWKTGTYDIITADDVMDKNIANWRVEDSNTRHENKLIITQNDLLQNILQLTAFLHNDNLVWGDGSENWNGETWDIGERTQQQFTDGDKVTFNGGGSPTVNVDLGNNKIADMVINVTDKNHEGYIFNGNLIGDPSTSNLPGAKGTLDISGKSKATFLGNADFQGISVSDTASVTLTEEGNGKLIARKDKDNSADSGNIIFGADTTLTLTPKEGLIQAAGKVELNGKVEIKDPKLSNEDYVAGYHISSVISAGEALDQLQLKAIFDQSAGLKSRLATFGSDDLKNWMDLLYGFLRVDDFAIDHGFNHNMDEAAKGVQGAFDNGDLGDLKDILYGFDTDEEVTDAIDQLRGTEMAASALAMSLWEPWSKVYKQLRNREECCPVHGIRGQESLLCQKREVWLEGYYRYLDVNGDGNAKKYYENRGGMVMGIDTKVHQFSTLGISFGYGNPKLSTKFGKVEAYDFTLALYGKTKIQSDMYLNGYAGLGFQEYKSDRYENIGTVSSQYKGNYNGTSGYLSMELYKSKKWNDAWTLFPLAALDYQRAWSSGYNEEGGHFAQSIHKSNVDRLVLRVGVDSKVKYSNSVNFLTRLQYGFMAGGDTRAKISSSFIGSTPTMEMTGVHLGRSQVDLGIGGEWYLDKRKCLKFFGDYDVNCGTRHAAQTGQLGLQVAW